MKTLNNSLCDPANFTMTDIDGSWDLTGIVDNWSEDPSYNKKLGVRQQLN